MDETPQNGGNVVYRVGYCDKPGISIIIDIQSNQ